MSNNGIVEHRKDYFYLEFREEYLIISKACKYKKSVKEGAKCKASPHCKALILAIMERWTDTKRKKGEDLAIYMTYPQWVEEMHELFGRNVIIDSLDELIGEGLISREKHKMYGKDTYKYRLNYQELNRRIKLLPQGKTFTSKRDETADAFTNQPDSSTSKRHTGLQVNEDAFKKGRNIESSTDSNNIDSERKNGAAQQKPSSTPEASIHSSVPSSSSLVEFDENEELIYGLLDEKNIGALKRNKEHKENCATLFNKGVVTLEQIDSLMQFCWQKPHLTGKDLYLKNLINCLNGWSQVQQQQKPTRVLSSYDDPDFVDDTFYPVKMTDEVLMEDVRETVHIYQADDSFDFYLQEIRHFKAQFNLTNYDVYTRIIEARKYANPERSNIDDFMHELSSSCIR